MKLAVFDGRQGMIALLDPVITRPTWTAVVFDHEGMGEAMTGLFEDRWRRGAVSLYSSLRSSPLLRRQVPSGAGLLRPVLLAVEDDLLVRA